MRHRVNRGWEVPSVDRPGRDTSLDGSGRLQGLCTSGEAGWCLHSTKLSATSPTGAYPWITLPTADQPNGSTS
jgi:hypothetical protein